MKRGYWFFLSFLMIADVGCGFEKGRSPLSGVAVNGLTIVDQIEKGATHGFVDLDSNTLGPSCKAETADAACIGIKYVTYRGPEKWVSDSSGSALSKLGLINQIWKKCGIAFQIDRFESVDPSTTGLSYQPANLSELDAIRKEFMDNSLILVVTTGSWDRSGTLGNSPANAWATMPEDSPHGVVIEQSMTGNIYAHELGHYLNLIHVSDAADLMNPVIYDESTGLTQDQCTEARSAIAAYWQRMLR